jgi:hypothetical protein
MPHDITDIVSPLVENGMFEDAETAVKNLMLDFILHQIHHYQVKIKKFEKKYKMNYYHFNQYLMERAKKVVSDKSLHQSIMMEEEDALDWKIAAEMLESWLGLKQKSQI